MYKNIHTYWKIAFIVFFPQAILGVIESVSIIHCHTTYGAECWPWFFIFSINIPVSILVAKIINVIGDVLSFYPWLGISFILFTGAGTLWWSGIIYLYLFSWRKG